MILAEKTLQILRRSYEDLLHTKIVEVIFGSAQGIIFLVLVLYYHEFGKNLTNIS
jgi:hypothetical protein